jgi:hypothetical protein
MRSQDWIVQKLTEARALIAQGWCQGDYYEDSDCGTKYCAVGAIRAAAEDQSYFYCLDYLGQTLAFMIGSGRYNVPNWNDAPGRTQQEVLALYDRAIDLAKSVNPSVPSLPK